VSAKAQASACEQLHPALGHPLRIAHFNQWYHDGTLAVLLGFEHVQHISLSKHGNMHHESSPARGANLQNLNTCGAIGRKALHHRQCRVECNAAQQAVLLLQQQLQAECFAHIAEVIMTCMQNEIKGLLNSQGTKVRAVFKPEIEEFCIYSAASQQKGTGQMMHHGQDNLLIVRCPTFKDMLRHCKIDAHRVSCWSCAPYCMARNNSQILMFWCCTFQGHFFDVPCQLQAINLFLTDEYFLASTFTFLPSFLQYHTPLSRK